MTRIPHGTEVKVTLSGTVRDNGGFDIHQGAQRIMDPAGFSHWVYLGASGAAEVHVVTEAHTEVMAGQVWRTDDGLYFARISRTDIPLRMTPADLSEERGLRTLDVHAFFKTYPDASLMYDPDKTPAQRHADALACAMGRHRRRRTTANT